MMVSNVEFRIPFTGHRRLALLNSRFLYSDLILFFDGGLAWDDNSKVNFYWSYPDDRTRIPVYSTGVSLRTNLFGMIILEPYYARPFQHVIKHPVWGLTFSAQGW
jgi:hypothetical protein